ncbi:synaptic vesicular amine transporter [Lepeophtheirus salmonis]|uniref:synaptic vesicular amine transporter n=1 Tax=Lepeophtheirus salmonis TaxID=72036 RepID=UPI001AE978CD|nr:synaptic vesicular amine transporter-like [Lepeophtheirus salmonis]XP_040575534.1 synaptic vesicular amine transporter-like [Lepeophtheirus salmonis]XP_040575535.1 synaptic vesicular amine transporter-like [Lepeophtheirus salmonis]
MGKIGDYVSRTRIGAYFHNARESRKLILLIVAIALLLDNMLLTTVVPIIPEFLYEIRHRHPYLTPTPEPPPTTVNSVLDYDVYYGGGDPSIFVDTLTQSSIPYLNESYAGEERRRQQNVSEMSEKERLALEKEIKHKDLVEENVEVGVMFASKAVVQLIANPFVGPLTNRIGYSIPMFAGFVIMFFSTIVFAFSRSYVILFFARALQGIGSSCSSVSGMGMLAERFPDDKERGNAMGIALGGLALGVLIGPPFGGIMYQFVGKTAPFLVLAMLALLDGCLQLLVLKPTITRTEEEAPSLKALIMDPYIIIAAGAITFANMGIAMLEPSLPIFMMDKMDSQKWEIGAAFLPASISYLIGTNIFGPLGHRMGRWKASFVGLIVIGFALFLVPFATVPGHLVIPMGAIGFGIGMVDSSMMPELGFLVDIRHSSVYGGVYAIGDIAFCLGYAVGPALSGSIVREYGFKAMLFGIGLLCLIYGPFLFLLKNPPPRSEQEKWESTQLMCGETKTTVKYANFDDELIGTSIEISGRKRTEEPLTK